LQGPSVTFHVGTETFKLPKGLVCHNSTYFDRAFNGEFIEGKTQSITVSASVDTFKQVIQWMYTSQVTLPSPTPSKKPKIQVTDSSTVEFKDVDSQQVTDLIQFLVYADEINLLGPFDKIIDTLKSILIRNSACLLPQHIRTAYQLPRHHPLQKLVVQACILDYAYHITRHWPSMHTTPRRVFRFNEEKAELDSFAADLLQEFEEVAKMSFEDEDGDFHWFDTLSKKGIDLAFY
jgi:hypothetical protein